MGLYCVHELVPPIHKLIVYSEGRRILSIESVHLGFMDSYTVASLPQLNGLSSKAVCLFWCNLPLHNSMQRWPEKSNQKQRRGAVSKGHKM